MSRSDNPKRKAAIDKAFVGKVVVNVDTAATNMWKFTFEDGSTQMLYAESAIRTPAGDIPGIFLEEELGQI